MAYLVRVIGLALTGRRCDEHLEAADEYLVELRILLRPAHATGHLQLGGWMRSR